MLGNLKPKQQEMLGILGRADVPVTLTDLKQIMGYRGDTSVRHHLSVLESFGLVQPRRKYEHRSVRLSTRGKMIAAAASLAKQAALKKRAPRMVREALFHLAKALWEERRGVNLES